MMAEKAGSRAQGGRGRRAVRGRWLTTEDVTEALRVAPGTVYRLVRSASLPAARVGGQWRFRVEDVEEWLSRRRVPPATEAR
jgi:excisionase family DNA binding protein